MKQHQPSYDDILEKAGGFRFFQLFGLLLYTLTVCILASHFGFLIFALAKPGLSCKNETIPSARCPPVIQFYSVVTEWNLYGSDGNYKRTICTTVQIVGFAVGVLIAGQLSDRFGRKLTFLFFFSLLCLFGIICGFSVDYTMFVIVLFFDGACTTSVSSITYVWYVENIPKKWRIVNYICSYGVGFTYLGIIAWLSPNWRKLTRWVHILAPAVLCIAMIQRESLKWLIQRKKQEKAERVLLWIGKWNRVSQAKLPFYELKQSILGETPPTLSYMNLFTSKTSTIHTLTLACGWIVTGWVHYGLTYNLSNFAGSIFLNVIILNVIKVCANTVIVLINHYVERYGRKVLFLQALSVEALCFVAVAFCYGFRIRGSVITGFAIIGMSLGTSVSWMAMEIYTAEIFPTLLRNMGYSFCSMMARIGGVCGPYSYHLFYLWKPAPFILFSGMCTAMAILVIFLLPETKNKTLPDLPEHQRGRKVASIKSTVPVELHVHNTEL